MRCVYNRCGAAVAALLGFVCMPAGHLLDACAVTVACYLQYEQAIVTRRFLSKIKGRAGPQVATRDLYTGASVHFALCRMIYAPNTIDAPLTTRSYVDQQPLVSRSTKQQFP